MMNEKQADLHSSFIIPHSSFPAMESFALTERGRRRNFRMRVLLTLALVIVFGLPLAFFAPRRFERAVTFHPAPYDGGASWTLPARGEYVWFKTRGGVRLHGWFVRAGADAPAATVIYFHGNGGHTSAF